LLEKTRYTGYVDPQSPDRESSASGEPNPSHPAGAPYVLCVVGGGQDGAGLARAFSRAKRPRDTRGLIVTGPFEMRGERPLRTGRHTYAREWVEGIRFIS